MTAMIFQAFFAAFLVMMVVIFQEELRHLFEQIALWSMGRRAHPTLRTTTADALVRAVADLARDHLGALIVLKGRDPLERHITGGIPLDGRVSEPLLKSLFEPHSPGHDGAVLVENNRVTHFAAHLPLSKDLTQLAGVGTRHSAGLGLAELSDALCIIVSEERGTVSVARDGRLRRLENVQALGTAIDSFINDKFAKREPATAPAVWFQMFRKNWLAKALAVALAIGFWYVLVPGSTTVQMSYDVPVSADNLPPDLQIEEIHPPTVTVTFSGPRRAFYLFDANRAKVIVDATLADRGRRTFTISEKDVKHPPEVQVQDINPEVVRLSLRKTSPEEATQG
jgi:uncharacterized protein (TIGR00159 family)